MAIGYNTDPVSIIDRAYRWIATRASKITPDVGDLLLLEAQDGFRGAQRLAYDCVEEVGALLKPGMTELDATKMLETYLKDHGVERYIHRPFAWFGNHTRFDEYSNYNEYHPSNRALKSDDVVILDISPVVNGYTADVGYTFAMNKNNQLETAMDFLRSLRAELPDMFMSEKTPKQIWDSVDSKIAAQGYDNIHARYPFCVLGHRVFKLKKKASKARRLNAGFLGWFSFELNLKFLKTGFSSVLSPENVGSKVGLWAIEPHIGWEGAGAKFEEILVVENKKAYWLDDNVPHLSLPLDLSELTGAPK